MARLATIRCAVSPRGSLCSPIRSSTRTAQRYGSLGSLQLTLHVVVFPAAVRLQSQAAVCPQLSLGAKPMWRLQQGDQQSRPNRTDIGNPLEQLRRAMLAALRQQIAPCLLA